MSGVILRSTAGADEVNDSGKSYRVNRFGCVRVPEFRRRPAAKNGRLPPRETDRPRLDLCGVERRGGGMLAHETRQGPRHVARDHVVDQQYKPSHAKHLVFLNRLRVSCHGAQRSSVCALAYTFLNEIGLRFQSPHESANVERSSPSTASRCRRRLSISSFGCALCKS